MGSRSPVAARLELTTTARTVLAARTLRGFADGFVSVVLARYLIEVGLTPFQIGAVVTATLLGSAALTLAFGLSARRTGFPALLVGASVIMVGTGVGFATSTSFAPLLVVGLIGTLNPSAGDVSAFLPTEQALLATEGHPADRPRLYARYNVGGTLAGAVGALISSTPEGLASRFGWDLTAALRGAFVVYAAVGLVILALYRRMPRPPVVRPTGPHVRSPLGSSRRRVLGLAALFSLDSAGGGLVVTSLLVLWLHLRFDLSAGLTGAVFFVTGVLAGCSQLLAPRLARRVGLIRTMAFTHMPANVVLVLTAFAPNGTVAIALLMVRSLFSQMDVPARQAFVMAVVPPEDRAAAASVTGVPRSLASALTPLAAGALLARSTFGWPLVIAGSTKLLYDVLLLVQHRNTPTGEHDGPPDRPAPDPPPRR